MDYLNTYGATTGVPFASVQAPAGLSRLSAWWIGLGIRLDRSRPGHVGDNAHHERMHLDIRNELEGMIEGGKEAHQAAFDIWREEFNEIRPHESLGMRRPAEVYEKSERRYEECELEIAYPDNFMERKVSKRGVIRLWSRSILITTSLAGWNVGLKHTDDKTLDVYFDYLRLGEIDLKTFTFHPTVRGKQLIISRRSVTHVLTLKCYLCPDRASIFVSSKSSLIIHHSSILL